MSWRLNFKPLAAVFFAGAVLLNSACHRAEKVRDPEVAAPAEGLLKRRVMVAGFANKTPQGQGKLEMFLENALNDQLYRDGRALLVPPTRLEEIKGIRGLPLVRDRVVSAPLAKRLWEELGVHTLIFGEILAVELKPAAATDPKHPKTAYPTLHLRVYVEAVAALSAKNTLNEVVTANIALKQGAPANLAVLPAPLLEELAKALVAEHRADWIAALERTPWTGRVLTVRNELREAVVSGGQASGLHVNQALHWRRRTLRVKALEGIDRAVVGFPASEAPMPGDVVFGKQP